MVRMDWSWLPVFLLVATSAAPGMGQPGQECTLLEEPLLVTQNDAGTGHDAPDARKLALVLPEQETITGALQLPSGTGDPSDWYGLRVGPQHEEVMIRLTSYSNENLSVWGKFIVVDVVPPGTDRPAVTVPIGVGTVTLPAQSGLWSFGVRFTDTFDGTCGDNGGLFKLDPMLTNYHLYVGCDPVCAEGV